ncbi:uncharacterized protein HMPREF1541_06335 [Cyphellophora europaea CBS 101466]|uniref:glycerophosphodiester phosphodiesterase n=1 Tax=Cyphellophora europaea (strain CBS 101466) TaxID=1220924 RepID=W2RRE8_CYPE1|nr:uncharacterized protein HMPREF1541_06335 [Cyphellophora europaea CBS 101466]ETN38304.1 hypothetical protein HMPREF1541_06335 [Cyphellophora europaea CBS 101466]
MVSAISKLAAAAAVLNTVNAVPLAGRSSGKFGDNHTPLEAPTPEAEYFVSYGPRPYYLINNMTESPLKQKLQSCENGPFEITAFSIAHRGGADLQIPEETVQSSVAGARMGAGINECDVAFTSDLKLVCRHDQCDLHTTTDIMNRPELREKCTTPFTPANETADASALCCTSDITLDEFLGLCSKMDGFNASATTPEDFTDGGIQPWRTTLYDTCGTVMTLESYIDLTNSFPGYRNFTPELKTPPAAVSMPFNGYTQAQFARDMVDTFTNKGISPYRVFPQSFLPDDVYLWIEEYPDSFGPQAVYLDEEGDDPADFPAAVARLPELKARGVNIIAPPINYLFIATGEDNQTIAPSSYALTAKQAGLDIVAWTAERSGPLTDVRSSEDYYFSTFADAVHTDGQFYELIDMLAQEVGIVGLFSDWSSSVSYYGSCMGLKGTYGEKYHSAEWKGQNKA